MIKSKACWRSVFKGEKLGFIPTSLKAGMSFVWQPGSFVCFPVLQTVLHELITMALGSVRAAKFCLLR